MTIYITNPDLVNERCMQNLVKFCPSILKILSKNHFLTSIKGCNSVANLIKISLYNTNIDLINVYVYTNLVKFCPSILKVLSKNQFHTSIKGRNSVASLRKITLYITNIDLVKDNVYTKFGYILPIHSQNIEQKPISGITPLQFCEKYRFTTET